MSDNIVALLLTFGFFAFIVGAAVLMGVIAEKVSPSGQPLSHVEDAVQRQRTNAYKAVVLLTIIASIGSVLG